MAPVFLLLVALVLPACDRSDPRSTQAPASGRIPEPVLPTVNPKAATTPPDAWMADLPDTPPVAAAGERVWAIIPGKTAVPRVGIFTVEGVYDGLYSLTDRKGQRVDGIPAAVVHRASGDKVESGDLVFFHAATAPGLLGRVAQLVPGGDIEVRYDWAGETRTTAADHAEAPRTGIRPLAFVSFPKGGRNSRGLIIALDARRAFIRSGSGHVENLPRAAVKSLPLPPDAHRVGERVRAFRWATGIQHGTVAEVLEPGLRYRVALDGDKPQQDYFFTTLLPL